MGALLDAADLTRVADLSWAPKCSEYGKASELTGADKEDQEVTMLALHLLQSALVYVNTIFLQRVLARP
ncbi:MAG: Tn3 family transposase, partial [Acidimicrobiales bacterium]